MTIGGGQLAAMQTSTFWSSPSRNLSTTLNKKKTALLLLIQIKLDWMKSIILILTDTYNKFITQIRYFNIINQRSIAVT